MSIDELLAREQIRETLAAYHRAGDRGRLDDYVATFEPDGILHLPSESLHGRAAIRAGLLAVGERRAAAGSATPVGPVQHHLTTSSITVDGATATGHHYFLVTTAIGPDHCGRYADRYVRIEDAWLIAERGVTVTWAAADSRMGAVAG